MGSYFLNEAMKIVIAAATPVLVGLVMALLLKLIGRLKLSISAEEQAKLEAIVRRAILTVEELMAAKLRAGETVTSADKLQAAIAEVTRQLPSVTPAEAASAIHAQLPLVRAAVPFGTAPTQ